MRRHLSMSIVCGLAAAASLTIAGTAKAQGTDSTRKATTQTTTTTGRDSTARRTRRTSRTSVTSSQRIRVRKDADNAPATTTSESTGAVAAQPNADSLARADSIANAARMRQDSIANAERMRQDSIARVERARQDSIANVERMRQDSIARADSLRAWNLAHMRRPGTGMYFQIAAGPSMPQSDFKNAFDNGWNVTGSLGYHPYTSPLGIRFDAAYDRFGAKSSFTGSSGNQSIWSGLADLTLRVPRMWAVSPYLLGGGGFSHFSGYNGGSSTTKGQWNAGGGIGFGVGNVKLFIESRYMHIATPGTATKYVPVVIGISL